ncbi:MAG: mechanosensitive ion channel family protein [Balneolaceae bacterium]
MPDTLDPILTNLSLILQVVIILLVTIIIQRVAKRLFDKFLKNNKNLKTDDATNFRFLYYTLVAVIYLVGFGFALWNIPIFQHVATSMLAGAGILAIVIGFASQQALANVVSGLLIVLFKPYRINDRITIQGTLSGVVEDINLWHTVIRNFENQRIIIPNSKIGNETLINSNYAEDKICRFINVGISYGSDIDLAKKIIAEEIEQHPNNMDVRTPEDIENGIPRVTVKVVELGESSVNLRGWAWAPTPPDGFVLFCDVTESVKKRFDKEGIVIPFPQRTLSYLEPAKSASSPKEQEL